MLRALALLLALLLLSASASSETAPNQGSRRPGPKRRVAAGEESRNDPTASPLSMLLNRGESPEWHSRIGTY